MVKEYRYDRGTGALIPARTPASCPECGRAFTPEEEELARRLRKEGARRGDIAECVCGCPTGPADDLGDPIYSTEF